MSAILVSLPNVVVALNGVITGALGGILFNLLKPCLRCFSSLIINYRQSKVDFLAFSLLPIIDFRVVEFHRPNIPRLYLGPLK